MDQATLITMQYWNALRGSLFALPADEMERFYGLIGEEINKYSDCYKVVGKEGVK